METELGPFGVTGQLVTLNLPLVGRLRSTARPFPCGEAGSQPQSLARSRLWGSPRLKSSPGDPRYRLVLAGQQLCYPHSKDKPKRAEQVANGGCKEAKETARKKSIRTPECGGKEEEVKSECH